jgi:hypothetical protein
MVKAMPDGHAIQRKGLGAMQTMKMSFYKSCGMHIVLNTTIVVSALGATLGTIIANPSRKSVRWIV